MRVNPILPHAVSRYLVVPMVLSHREAHRRPECTGQHPQLEPQMEMERGQARRGFAEGGAWAKDCQSFNLFA